MDGSRFILSDLQWSEMSRESLRHWGLLHSPFAVATGVSTASRPHEFHWSSPENHRLSQWILEQLKRGTPVVQIAAPRGSGLTSCLKQHVSTRGIDRLALNVIATDASDLVKSPHWGSDQRLLQLVSELHRHADQAERGIQALWIVDHAEETLLERLMGVGRELVCTSRLTILVVSRDSFSTSLLPTFRREYEQSAGLATCAKRALLHAGQAREIVSDDAVNVLARHAVGRYDVLASLVHQCLCWGFQSRLRRIDGKRVQRFLKQHESESKFSWQVDAEGPVVAAAA